MLCSDVPCSVRVPEGPFAVSSLLQGQEKNFQFINSFICATCATHRLVLSANKLSRSHIVIPYTTYISWEDEYLDRKPGLASIQAIVVTNYTSIQSRCRAAIDNHCFYCHPWSYEMTHALGFSSLKYCGAGAGGSTMP